MSGFNRAGHYCGAVCILESLPLATHCHNRGRAVLLSDIASNNPAMLSAGHRCSALGLIIVLLCVSVLIYDGSSRKINACPAYIESAVICCDTSHGRYSAQGRRLDTISRSFTGLWAQLTKFCDMPQSLVSCIQHTKSTIQTGEFSRITAINRGNPLESRILGVDFAN